MSEIKQTAGKIMLSGWTDGSPLWVTVTVAREVDGKREIRLSGRDDLLDLQYAIGRFLDKEGRKP